MDDLGSDSALRDIIIAFKNAREGYEPMMYMSRRAYEGKHFVVWNKTQQQLQEQPNQKGFFNQLPEVAISLL